MEMSLKSFGNYIIIIMELSQSHNCIYIMETMSIVQLNMCRSNESYKINGLHNHF